VSRFSPASGFLMMIILSYACRACKDRECVLDILY